MRIKQREKQENAKLSGDDKKDLVKYSQHLFDSQTSALWSAVPDDVLYKLYKKAMTICRQTCHHEHTKNIIDLLLQQPAVFNSARVQMDPQYDTYTASIIDDIVADPESTSESRYNALPHLIRRNNEQTNKIIIDWLDSDELCADKICQVKPPSTNSCLKDSTAQEVTAREIFRCASSCNNRVIEQEIIDRRMSSVQTSNPKSLYAPPSPRKDPPHHNLQNSIQQTVVSGT